MGERRDAVIEEARSSSWSSLWERCCLVRVVVVVVDVVVVLIVVVGVVVGMVVVVVVGLADVAASALSLTVSISVTTGGVTIANRPHCCKNVRLLASGLSPSPVSPIMALPSLEIRSYHAMERQSTGGCLCVDLGRIECRSDLRMMLSSLRFRHMPASRRLRMATAALQSQKERR